MSIGIVCPRCGTPLASVQTRSALLSGCQACGGVWLDNGSTQRVIDALCGDTVGRADALSRFAQRPTDRERQIACPVCTQALARWTVPEANIDVDFCRDHGTWFDRDELGAVARSYAARRAYGGGAAAGVAVAGAGAVAMAAQDPGLQERARQAVQGIDAETVIDVGTTALEFVDPVDVVEGAGVAAEFAGGLFGVLGGILDGF
jgi:Zn-finger nucleic acid-binding protein